MQLQSRVSVAGTWYTDLYRTLNLDFGSSGFTGALNFSADTDNLLYPGDIKPVPEPATMLLLGTGIIGLAALGRKKFQKK